MMPMMATTMSNSISVKPLVFPVLIYLSLPRIRVTQLRLQACIPSLMTSKPNPKSYLTAVPLVAARLGNTSNATAEGDASASSKSALFSFVPK